MSVNGKIELKMRKRLIFSRSFRNLGSRITKGAGLLFVEVFLLLLAAGGKWNGNFLIRADCSLHYPMWRLNDAPYLVISPYLDILKAMIHRIWVWRHDWYFSWKFSPNSFCGNMDIHIRLNVNCWLFSILSACVCARVSMCACVRAWFLWLLLLLEIVNTDIARIYKSRLLSKVFDILAGQIRGQVSACRAWNALPNNVEHKVEAIMEPFRSPAGDRTWVL